MRPRGKTPLLNGTRWKFLFVSRSSDELYTAEGFDCGENALLRRRNFQWKNYLGKAGTILAKILNLAAQN